jgi:DNA-binding transcriptional ArsR family regulator
MKAGYHSTFTPSESDQETLEKLLVAREDLVRGIMEGIRESAQSENKHQRLLIGPRGSGKTHLVALVYHRVRADPELSERLRIAWLPEDPYVAGYPDLLLEILRTLARDDTSAGLRRRLDEILDLKSSREAALERLLLETLGERTLLLLTENLDDLMRDLKEEGQHRLRAFLQNHPRVTILATATSLVDAVAERKKTFYGFFRISPLEPFSVEQAVQLLDRLADRAHDDDLAAAIRSAMGRARIRAVHYLAGGNPRIYVLLYGFLSRESLDDLARPFLKLVDELTPYYQARMSRLAPLQRRIIDVLRRLRGASTVTEIARQTMSSPQSISSQLGKLKDLGYVVQVDSLGRSNYYELREPLMRLVLEVKEQQGRSVDLFVQFLRAWYAETELDRTASDPDRLLLKSSNPEEWRPLITTCLASFRSDQRLAELGQGLVRSLRVLAQPWVSDQSAQAWYQAWQELAGDTDEMALPLRLLEAGIEYRLNRDPRMLLRLPREERGLLEPWLVDLFPTPPSHSSPDSAADQHPPPAARR